MKTPSLGASLLADAESFISKYVSLPDEGAALTVATWAASTYLMDVFNCHPFLAVTSPTMRCGKSRLLEVLELLVFQPMLVASITPAALFRIVSALHPTLLVDEQQNLTKRDARSALLHDLLAAGHRRGANVVRVANGLPVKFEVFSPKVVACIGRLAPILTDRSIDVRMRRRLREERVARFFQQDALKRAKPLQKRFALWALASTDTVAKAYRTRRRPNFLADREAENWQSVLVTASIADPSAAERLEAAAKLLSRQKTDADETSDDGVRLLADIQHCFRESHEKFLRTQELLGRLHGMEEAEWRDYGGRGLSPETLSRLLRAFDIRPRLVHRRPDSYRGYGLDDFADAFARYVTREEAVAGGNRSDVSERRLSYLA